MAYQSKKHRKFLATSMTAALVATAVAPAAGSAASNFTDVPADNFYYEYVKALADANIIDGRPDGSFDLGGKVTRAEASKMLANILQLDTKTAPAANFSDVKQDVWYAGYVNALSAKGLINGKGDGKFDPNGTLTRAEFAKMVVEAYDLELKADGPVASFTDINGKWYTDYVKILFSHGLITGTTSTTFSPEAQIKRGDFAKLLVVSDREYGITLGAAKVTGVSAINPTTLKVEGHGLKKLKAEDVTVVGNKVVAVTPAADGKSATVTLESKLAPTADVTVSVTVNGEKKDFTIKFEYKVTSVVVNEVTFDDDRAGQKVGFKVNGESTDADIDYLKLAGYSVNFVAIDKATGNPENIFVGGTSSSTTGVLDQNLAGFVGKEIEIQVQLSKSGEALVSDKAIVKFANLDAAATAVDTVVFAVDKDNNGVAYNANGSTALAGTDFALNSTKLVAGEVVGIHQVKSIISGSKEIIPQTGFTVESSNPAVISYNSGTGLLKAESAGTATITVKVGQVSKTFTFTVVNEDRKLAKVVANPSSLAIVKGHTNKVEVKTFDQYGDPFAVASADVTEVLPVAADGTTPLVTAASVDVDTDGAGSIGVATLTVTGNEVGKGTVHFKDATTGQVLGSLFVDVTAVNNVGSQKLEIVKVSGQSEDNTLDVLADNKVTYKLANYNTNGVYRDNQDLNGYQLEVVDGTVAEVTAAGTASPHTANATITVSSSTTTFDITALKAGKTDVLLKKSDGTVVGKITITVVKDPIKITGVNWKQLSKIDYVGEVINYKDVLSITDSTAGDIVDNITLSKSTAYKVRISEGVASGDAAGDEGKIYLDKDADGKLDSGEELGWIELSKTSDSSLGAITNAITGYTTAANDKGTLVFKVYVDADGDGIYEANEAVAATSVTVEVK